MKVKVGGCHDCKFKRPLDPDQGVYYCTEVENDGFCNIVTEEKSKQIFHKDCPYIGKSVTMEFEKLPVKPKCGDCKNFEFDVDVDDVCGSCKFYSKSDEGYQHIVGPNNKAYDCEYFELKEGVVCDTCKTCRYWTKGDNLRKGCSNPNYEFVETLESFICDLWKRKGCQ